jgi:hypothetical protein
MYICIYALHQTGSSLDALLQTQLTTNVSLISYDDNSKIRVFRACNDQASSSLILKALSTATTAVTTTVVTSTPCSGTTQVYTYIYTYTYITSTPCLGITQVYIYVFIHIFIYHKQVWKSRKCIDLSTALCVDCIDPCGRTQCPSLNTLNPCSTTQGNAYGCPAVNVNIDAYRYIYMYIYIYIYIHIYISIYIYRRIHMYI